MPVVPTTGHGSKDNASALISKDAVQQAASVIIATKANWWVMNHHTGQGKLAGYAGKVLNIYFGNNVPADIVSMAHRAGHWCSTLHLLNEAGISSLRRVVPQVPPASNTLVLSMDAMLRFTSLPAVTHRLAVAFEAAKRLLRTEVGRYCPDVLEFVNIPPKRHDVLRAPAKFHIGASYLTRADKADYNDQEMGGYLGRLGTFVCCMFPKSTLASSPHLEKPKVQSYEDYSPEWETLLTQYKINSSAATETALQSIGASTSGVAANAYSNARTGFR